eukprot:gnl/TRDRNA2_/TRDRNA2_158877_c0_seq1.p1 gnl/TRDRNA2_/TRDRNA2_158877_c0~~gnl/TRDRNA2_/TRDRNA2_158877_c0_seq1.p1  ORF type:complete len:381 (+),score=83.05 gnl/TRDRNA2_/TRDRNA2_158877_c0_seq1:140-1144(+)
MPYVQTQPPQAPEKPAQTPAGKRALAAEPASTKDMVDQIRRSASLGSFAGAGGSGGAQPAQGRALGKYRAGRCLGKGASAVVWEGVDDSGQLVAVKVFDKNRGDWRTRQRQAQKEVRLLELLKPCEHLVHVVETFETPLHFHICLELVNGGSLRQMLSRQPTGRLEEARACGLYRQVCKGLNFCHQAQVVHRDIKLENLLLDHTEQVVKVIDFGFAVQLKSQEQPLKVFCGTPSYMAPEIVMGKEYSGFATDVWALGVVLYALLAGHLPFIAENESQLYAKIRRGTFRNSEGVNDIPRRLITGMLRPDARSRPTLKQVLQHAWFETATGMTDEC